MPNLIERDLAPFVEARSGRGIVLQIRNLGDGFFELVTIVPGHGAKQGGLIAAQDLFSLGRAMTLAASEQMAEMWHRTPTPATRNGTTESHRV